MAIKINGVGKRHTMLHNGALLKKGYHNSKVELWASGSTVLYCVDTNENYAESVSNGASCLNPTKFVPEKSGWTFVGWREDGAASSDVLTSKVMGTESITLYAVFKKKVTVTYYNDTKDKSSTIDYAYYNNGNVKKAAFSLHQSSKDGWNPIGWSESTEGNGTILYANEARFERDSDVTLYGVYLQTIYVTYDGNGATSGGVAKESRVRAYNSSDKYYNPEVVLPGNGFTRRGYTFTKWAMGSADGTRYDVGAKVTISGDTTFYARWTSNGYTWVNNYVGVGEQLEITISKAENVLYKYPVGTVLSEFKVESDRSWDDQVSILDFYTNTVGTRGCKTMVIRFNDFWGARGSSDYLMVCSPSGAVLGVIHPQQYGTTQAIDVSSADEVYICCTMGAWAYNTPAHCKIEQIVLTN